MHSIGARVMKACDSGPVTRDPEFLVEAGIVPRATADRVFRRQRAFRTRGPGGGGGGNGGDDQASDAAVAAAKAALAAEAAGGGEVCSGAAAAAAADKLGSVRCGDASPLQGGSPRTWPGAPQARAAPVAADQGEAPVTIYSFDPASAPDSPRSQPTAGAPAQRAKHTVAESFYRTGGPKSTPMARSDHFTKLDGDVNKLQDGGL
jgi:hypothetical protein